MSQKILGLDLGTNSIGWAAVETEDQKQFKLIDKGVRIFQEGVKIEKGVEGSKAAERTAYRSARRIKYRRKLRKINTLKVLSNNGYCPQLSAHELDEWRYKRVYPKNNAFRDWWLTDHEGAADQRKAQTKNPYYFRHLAASEKLDLTQEKNRHLIGRAFYHMAQRRGFLSNRLETTKESEGAVTKNIAEISQAKGDLTLGQYFYGLYQKGEKIRDQYTHREAHYLAEFNSICHKQDLPADMVTALKKAIFYQRPLKSQKGAVGKCPFETNKPRCAVSHPLFEEYRMRCFINNIKIKTPTDERLRFLTEAEKAKIIPQFFRKKDHFDFEDLAKQLAPKKQYQFYKSRTIKPEDWLFNYDLKTTVSGCPVSARFKSLFGDDWAHFNKAYIREKDGQHAHIDIHDVWHVLFTYDSADKLKEFAHHQLALDDKQMDEFMKMHLKQDYASLSLKAINKILPYLREGLIYSHAVFLANMGQVIPADVWADAENQHLIRQEIQQLIHSQNEAKQVTEVVNTLIKHNREAEATWSKEAIDLYRTDLVKTLKNYYGAKKYQGFEANKKQRLEAVAFDLFQTHMQKNMGRGEFAKAQRIDDRIRQFLADHFNVNGSFEKLYHPSALDVYQAPTKGKDGNYYLGSPMVSSVRNPMAMRALHQLRHVINELIRTETIDTNTTIHIEMARDLMNANERKALQSWQRDRENKRKGYAQLIKKHFEENNITRDPSDEEILKYQLWEEQNHICLYTGQQIGLTEFLGADPVYDLEHTIPQSLSFDNSQVNKTLCQSRFNRATKRNKIPAELNNHAAILERIEHWQEESEKLNKQIKGAVRTANGASTKEEKDRAIQKRHRLTLERDYLRDKHRRFILKDVPTGFKNSQLVDTGIITKYARLYLKTLFNRTFTVKGSTVADFRKFWGLQDIYAKKQRVNHIHHCIDAITIACMTPAQYAQLAQFYQAWEGSRQQGIDKKPTFAKPWPTFTEEVKAIEQELLVSHYTPDNLPKKNQKKLRKRGQIQCTKNGQAIIQTGDSVRGSLHKDTFYGAIEREVKNKKGETEKVTKYVVRKKLDMLTDGDLKNIVDDRIKAIVINARQEEKALRKKLEALTKQLQKAEEHEEPAIREGMSQLEQAIVELYALPTKKGGYVPIKKVRLYQPTVTNPLRIKDQRDKAAKSPKPHKEHYYAANDGNYLMAIYEGKDAKGKIKRDFELVNRMKAGKFFKESAQSTLRPQGFNKQEDLIPQSKQNGSLDLPLKATLKIGTMIILWENNPEEVWDLELPATKKRLYKIVGLSEQVIQKKYFYGTIVLRHQNEARPTTELKVQDGEFKTDEEYMAFRKMNHNQFNALIEGIDFKLTSLGKIERL